MENKIFLGVITSSHGIKGELKIKSDFDKKNIVFKKGFAIYINGEKHIITSYRPHKGFDMVTIDNITDINEVYKYVKSNVYIIKDDLNLKDNEYLLSDLPGFEVYDNNELIGKVIEIRKNIAHDLLYIAGNTNFYIPLIDQYIEKIDLENKKIVTRNGKDLMI